jgi:hypothetical protein
MDERSKTLNPNHKERTAAQRARKEAWRRDMRNRGFQPGYNVSAQDTHSCSQLFQPQASRGGLGSRARGGAQVLVPGEYSRGQLKRSIHTSAAVYVGELSSGVTRAHTHTHTHTHTHNCRRTRPRHRLVAHAHKSRQDCVRLHHRQ